MSELRSGPSWEVFLATYKLRGIKDTKAGYAVESASGSTYQVNDYQRLDDNGSLHCGFKCSCPARGECRHIDAVEQMLYCEAASNARDGDTDGMDVVERFEGGGR